MDLYAMFIAAYNCQKWKQFKSAGEQLVIQTVVATVEEILFIPNKELLTHVQQ